MKRKISLLLILALWLGMAAFAWVKPADEMSDSERRDLAQFPALTVDTLLSGSFMTKFADYAVDQFPLRDGWRRLNAYLTRYAMGQKDTNGIYIYNDYAVKMEYPLDRDSVDFAKDRFQDLYELYLADSDCDIRFVLVPDKNYYLADEAGALSIDYEALFAEMAQELSWAEFVDVTDTLSIDSYYRTDTHWRQEMLLPTVGKITESFGFTATGGAGVSQWLASEDFYGVYYGQAALPMEPDTLVALTWEGWEDCELYSYDTGVTSGLYDSAKLESKDPYEFFCSGNMAVQTVTNPHASTDRELIVFRDSFGSSIAPLLAREYARVTLIDTRYVFPAALGEIVDFADQDVLFLYSTLVLNTSSALRK